MKKIILIILAVAVLFVGYVQLSWDKVYDAPYPEISASTDPTAYCPGEIPGYLGQPAVRTCHVPMDKIVEVDKGLEIPLNRRLGIDYTCRDVQGAQYYP